MAGKLARGLAAIDTSLVDVERVHTNIVNCFVDGFVADAAHITRRLRECGILANSKGTKIRFVTHYHIDEAAVAAAVQAVGEVVASLRKVA
jgi:threonine aldolase